MVAVVTQKQIVETERESIRAELLALAEKHGGYLAPETVVEAAADPNSVLHSRFVWDDTEAARRFRLVQAAVLLRQIRVTVVRPALEEADMVHVVEVRQFQSDPEERGKATGSYMRVETLMEDPQKRKALLESVIGELRGIRKRYRELTELADVWAAVDKLTIQG
jgi:hypothetical protein